MLFGTLLLLIRGISAAGARTSEPEISLFADSTELRACPREFISQVFSSHDSEFVLATNSSQLVRMFRYERRQVALVWVKQTSAAIQSTMREHKHIARMSNDLEFQTEVKLWLLYSELMLLCGVLFVAVQSIGPLSVRRLAMYADAHSQRLAQVQQSFKEATSPRELPRVGAA